MKKLQLRFKTGDGHKKTFILSYVKADLDKPTVDAAMEKISASKIFEKDTVELYQTALDSKYVERVETPIVQDSA